MRIRPWGALALALAGCSWPFGHGPYAGQVVDAAGHGIAGAAIASDRAATLSGPDGRFSLVDPGGTVTVRHVGYQPRTVRPDRDLTVPLTPMGTPLSIAWDVRWQSPPVSGLVGYLQARGFAVEAIASGDLPAGRDVYVLSSPAYFSDAAYQAYRQRALDGAKIVVLGDWGGYDGVDLAACNAVCQGSGIRFATALVRTYASGDPQDWLTLHDSGFLGADLPNGVRLFTAGALDLQAPAIGLVSTATSAVRIQGWSRGSQMVCAAGPLGRGTLVALTDCSVFSDETGPDGTPHWRTLDNARFAEKLLAW
jgi:hypothetical protein